MSTKAGEVHLARAPTVPSSPTEPPDLTGGASARGRGACVDPDLGVARTTEGRPRPTK